MGMTPEERLVTLEQSFRSMEDGILRVERAVEKLDIVLAGLMDRLDARYPSQESVNLRFEEMRKELETVVKLAGENKQRIEKIQFWQYKVIGASAVVAFGAGIVAKRLIG